MNSALHPSLILLLGCLGGCTTFEVEGNGSITPGAVTGSETVHGSIYGFRWRDSAIEKCGSESLFRVEFHTNAGFLLASVASLGLYVPQTVEWWCNSSLGDDSDEEVWVPPPSGEGK